MKKFLMTALFAFAILLPMTATVEAADIPDIRQINPGNIKPEVSIFKTDYTTYVYECIDDNGCLYAAQFVQMLTRNYPFKVVCSYTEDNFPEWALVYTGSKRVSFSKEMGECHILVFGSDLFIDVSIVKGLSYAGHFVKNR